MRTLDHRDSKRPELLPLRTTAGDLASADEEEGREIKTHFQALLLTSAYLYF